MIPSAWVAAGSHLFAGRARPGGDRSRCSRRRPACCRWRHCGKRGAVAGQPFRVAGDPGQRDRPGRCRAAAGPGPGRYLTTSRRASGWHATGAVPVRLDVLDPAEAQALLAAILAPDEPREADGAARLCAELGFLPLAIEQAAPTSPRPTLLPREYLDLLARILGFRCG
jgi:hypothetical protein